MRRPVTVFAWIRHQQATGYEVANRQREGAEGLPRPPTGGRCRNAMARLPPTSRISKVPRVPQITSDILSDRCLLFCVHHSLLTHATHPSHQEQSGRAHRL